MARYFDHCTTVEELKKAYHRAAMENHPDQGGKDADMMEVNKQYEEAAARIARGGKTTGKADPASGAFDPEAFRQAVEVAARHPDMILELVGRWLWATGNTFAHKEALKAAGYQWSHKHRAWYFRDDMDICTRGGKKTLEEIKAKYGSERITSTGWSHATLTA